MHIIIFLVIIQGCCWQCPLYWPFDSGSQLHSHCICIIWSWKWRVSTLFLTILNWFHGFNSTIKIRFRKTIFDQFFRYQSYKLHIWILKTSGPLICVQNNVCNMINQNAWGHSFEHFWQFSWEFQIVFQSRQHIRITSYEFLGVNGKKNGPDGLDVLFQLQNSGLFRNWLKISTKSGRSIG